MGKSMPMMETFSTYSMVAVYKTRGEVKFIHLKSDKFLGMFTILIFMDDKLTEMEIDEWKDFSNHVKELKQCGAYIVGVCTDSHISLRAMMMNSLQDITFPIISDRDGDFSRSFGVLKLQNGKFAAARALVILDTRGRMVHLALHNEHTRSYPVKVMELIKHLKGDVITAVDKSADSLKSLSVSTAISSVSSKSVDDESAGCVTSLSVSSAISDEYSTSDEEESPKEIKKHQMHLLVRRRELNRRKEIRRKLMLHKKPITAQSKGHRKPSIKSDEKDGSKEIKKKENKHNEKEASKEKNKIGSYSNNTKVKKEVENKKTDAEEETDNLNSKRANMKKHASDKKNTMAVKNKGKGHKKPSSLNWIEAGTPLSQD